MKMRTVRYIELDQIQSDGDIKYLLEQVQQPDVSIYLFWPKGSAINPLIGACIKDNQFQKLSIEEYWYKDPNPNGDFIRIERDPELDWQKRIQETQQMLCRAELKLPAKRGPLAIFMDRRKKRALIDGGPIAQTQRNPSTSQIVSNPGQADRRGRKPKVDWNGAIKNFIFERLDHHGPPQLDDPEWSCQADVEKAVADHIMRTFGLSISESVVRDHTRRLMFEHQQQKAGK
jgi:hypothetical protein